MLIVYGKGIEYDTQSPIKDELIVNIANLITGKQGKIILIAPANIIVNYDLQTGQIEIESKVGGVNNSFSKLEEQMIKPIVWAMSLKVKTILLEELTKLPDITISTRIKVNHGISGEVNQHINLTLTHIDNTLMQIAGLGVEKTGMKLFSEAKKSEKTLIQEHVCDALNTIGVKNITSLEEVSKISNIPESRLNAEYNHS